MEFIKLYRIFEDGDTEDINKYCNQNNIWETIYNKYLKDDVPYDEKYTTEIKKYIYKEFPNIIDKLNKDFGSDIMEDDSLEISMITSLEYKKHDAQFSNEYDFANYIVNESKKEDKKTIIDEEILHNAGFVNITEDFEINYYLTEFSIEDYSSWQYWTNKEDKNYIKIIMSKDVTNNGAKWHMHLDNDDCCSIGSADIDTVWQFNTLMEVFGSKFRL